MSWIIRNDELCFQAGHSSRVAASESGLCSALTLQRPERGRLFLYFAAFASEILINVDKNPPFFLGVARED